MCNGEIGKVEYAVEIWKKKWSQQVHKLLRKVEIWWWWGTGRYQPWWGPDLSCHGGPCLGSLSCCIWAQVTTKGQEDMYGLCWHSRPCGYLKAVTQGVGIRWERWMTCWSEWPTLSPEAIRVFKSMLLLWNMSGSMVLRQLGLCSVACSYYNQWLCRCPWSELPSKALCWAGPNPCLGSIVELVPHSRVEYV